MLDWLQKDGNEEDEREKSYTAAIKAFNEYVSNSIKEATEIAAALNREYPTEALNAISARFEKISMTYTNFTIIVIPSNEVIRRSKARSGAAQKVALRAKSIAQLFERYAANPRSFSPVNGRLQINKLIAELRNLLLYLT